ncbi:MAG: hypothetical protein ACJ731_07850 [Vicinamibacterales bacterium]
MRKYKLMFCGNAWAPRIIDLKMVTPERLLRGSVGLRLKVVLALYVSAAALLPFGHHDLVCHIKSTTHCTTCAVGSSAEATGDSTILARFWLFDAGVAIIEPVDAPHAATIGPASGRAPPVA